MSLINITNEGSSTCSHLAEVHRDLLGPGMTVRCSLCGREGIVNIEQLIAQGRESHELDFWAKELKKDPEDQGPRPRPRKKKEEPMSSDNLDLHEAFDKAIQAWGDVARPMHDTSTGLMQLHLVPLGNAPRRIFVLKVSHGDEIGMVVEDSIAQAMCLTRWLQLLWFTRREHGLGRFLGWRGEPNWNHIISGLHDSATQRHWVAQQLASGAQK